MKNARRVGCVFVYAPVPRWRGNLSFSSLYIQTAMASLESYNCSCSNMQVHNAEAMALDLCLATLYAWLQTGASRPLIGRQTMHAEWHMFLPLMTLLSQLGDRTGEEEAPPSDMLMCQNPSSSHLFDPAFCCPNAAATPLHADK